MVILQRLFWIFLTLLTDQITQTNVIVQYSDRSNLQGTKAKHSEVTQTKTTSTLSTPFEKRDEEEIEPDENGEQVNVHNVLDNQNETESNNLKEISQTPTYYLDWTFTDKNTIRVTFDLFKIPNNFIHKHTYANELRNKMNILATMVTIPTPTLISITSLHYHLFTIRSYKTEKEVHLKLEKLHLRNNSVTNSTYYTNSLLLTGLNHKEKYTICIFYFQNNISTSYPDLVLCQDIINDHSKFADLRADAKHGLFFIVTQYSIILVLLIFLQSSYMIRKRHVTEIIRQQLSTKAQTIRTTLSSISLGRQSFSSLDHGEHHATNGHATTHEPTIDEEDIQEQKEMMTSPSIIISDSDPSTKNEFALLSEENQPFLRKVPSKNHVHFLLGPSEEGSEDEFDPDFSFDQNRRESQSSSTRRTSLQSEPYGDQKDALSSMAHILDTNKPWSRHNQDSSLV